MPYLPTSIHGKLSNNIKTVDVEIIIPERGYHATVHCQIDNDSKKYSSPLPDFGDLLDIYPATIIAKIVNSKSGNCTIKKKDVTIKVGTLNPFDL